MEGDLWPRIRNVIRRLREIRASLEESRRRMEALEQQPREPLLFLGQGSGTTLLVLGCFGDPVEGAVVSLLGGVGESTQGALTDADGLAAIFGTEPDTWSVQIIADGYAATVASVVFPYDFANLGQFTVQLPPVVGYNAIPFLFFDAPTGVGGVTAGGYCRLLASGLVQDAVVTNPGSGYASAPAVAIGDTYDGAKGYSILGCLTGFNNTRTTGFTPNSRPGLAVAPPTPASGATATCTLTPDGGIDSIAITNAGTNYWTIPTVTIRRPNWPPTFNASGIAPTLSVRIDGAGHLAGIDVIDPSTGYFTAGQTLANWQTAPTYDASSAIVTITGGNGRTATGTAAADGAGNLTLTLADGGYGYTSAPTVTLTVGGVPDTTHVTPIMALDGVGGVVITDAGRTRICVPPCGPFILDGLLSDGVQTRRLTMSGVALSPTAITTLYPRGTVRVDYVRDARRTGWTNYIPDVSEELRDGYGTLIANHLFTWIYTCQRGNYPYGVVNLFGVDYAVERPPYALNTAAYPVNYSLTSGVTTRLLAVITGDAISAVTVLDGGFGYDSPPVITIAAEPAHAIPGRVAEAHCVMGVIPGPGVAKYQITSITVDDGGDTYSSAPTVTVSGGFVEASPFGIAATLAGDAVTAVSVGNGGVYTHALPLPTVSFGAAPTGAAATIRAATATAVMGSGADSDKIDHVVITDGGAGYYREPVPPVTVGPCDHPEPILTASGAACKPGGESDTWPVQFRAAGTGTVSATVRGTIDCVAGTLEYDFAGTAVDLILFQGPNKVITIDP